MSYLSKSPHRSDRRELKENSGFDLEWDLRSTDWILNKVRSNSLYAQNLYAALCNNRFRKTDIESSASNLIKILKEEISPWSCSWRYAGGIVSDMCEQGDYLDFYCSGIIDEESQEKDSYVYEGHVTEEIRSDLLKLGWIVIEESEEI